MAETVHEKDWEELEVKEEMEAASPAFRKNSHTAPVPSQQSLVVG